MKRPLHHPLLTSLNHHTAAIVVLLLLLLQVALALAAVVNFCPSCGFGVQGMNFCSQCGEGPFGGGSSPAVAAAAPPPAPTAATSPDREGGETVTGFLPSFLESRQSEVSPATYRTETGFWYQDNGMLETIGSTPLSSLCGSTFEAHLLSLKARGLSTRTQSLHRSAFLAFLKYCSYMSLTPHPADVRPVAGRRVRESTILPFTAAEVALLLDHATSPQHRCLFGVAIGQGLRPSEAVSLRWEDLRGDSLRVRGTKTKQSDSVVPLTDLSRREVERWRFECTRFGGTLEAARFYANKNPDNMAFKDSGLEECLWARKRGEQVWSHSFDTLEKCAEFIGKTKANVKKVLEGGAKSTGGWEVKEGRRKVESKFKLKPLKAPIGTYKYTPAGLTGGYEVEEEGQEDGLALIGPMFLHPRTGAQIISFKKALETSASRAGVDFHLGEPRRVFPYLLRHSFATLAATSNPPVPVVVAQKVMRHSSSKMLLDVYAKAGDEVVRDGLGNFKL